MNIIVLTKSRGRARQINLKHPGVVLLALLLIGGLIAATFYAGSQYALYSQRLNPDARVLAWNEELEQQRAEIADARRVSEENLNALSARLSEMNAHIIRLDAMGRRLTTMADMDDGEFDFDNPPAMGGPEPSIQAASATMPALLVMLDELAVQVEDRQDQLGVLENLLMNRNLSEQVYPKGRPVNSGWISSYFGKRTDPFNGREATHKGLDFAGREGSEVVAVAAGVVTWSGDRYGYGEMVEINHGNGYVTRYAHNKDNLVAVGDEIAKGQTIALMGSTGRATGPNLHFEVLHNGRVVNPLKYIRASK